MSEKLLKILLKTYNNIFVLSGILIILFTWAIYLLLGKGAADALIEQMLHREQTVARSGAISVGLFMNNLSSQTSVHSTRPAIVSFDPKNAPKDLEVFMERWKGTPVSGLILVDEDGIVRFGRDRYEATGEGVSVAERDYFKWAKTAKEGEVFIVEPFQSKIGFTSGRYVVSAVSPVFSKGRFNGALVTGFLLDEANKEFLDPLKITENTRIYLVDQNGVILSGPVPKLIGLNYLDYLKKSGISGAEKTSELLTSTLTSEKEGKLDIILPNDQKKGAPTRYLIAYSPIIIGSQHWTLAVATPATDALEFLTPFYFKDLGLAGLAFLAFLIISIRISKIKGYEEGIEEEKKAHGET